MKLLCSSAAKCLCKHINLSNAKEVLMQSRFVLDHEQMLVAAGGNLDNRRIGIGASMYYPVSVEGALLSMGDAHSAQGDSEFDGQSHAWTLKQSHTHTHTLSCT